MEWPKSWNELVLWAGMQFPVLLVTVIIGRWLLVRGECMHQAERSRTEAVTERLLAEREMRIHERDAIILEKDAENQELKAKLARPRRSKKEGQS